MARENRMKSGSSNPATKFIQWKSTEKSFQTYDKQKEQKVVIDLPVKFLALCTYITVKGWNQKREGAIIANEVRNHNEILNVDFYPKSGEKQRIASGKWSEIKDTVDAWDGKYTQSVYAMLPGGELVNFQLNGSGLGNWFDFQKNRQDDFFNHWVEITSAEEGKQGAVTFYSPVYKFGGVIDSENEGNAEICDGLIAEYEANYFKGPEATPDSEVDKYKEKVEANLNLHEGLQPTPPPEFDESLVNYDPDDLPF